MHRLIFRLAGIVLTLLALLPLHYLWTIAGRPSPWPRRFLGSVARLAGMRASISGQPLPGHVLVVSNHLSWLDILLIAGASGASFVSKAEVAGWPVVGWLARLHSTVFVARAERSAVKGQADALREALAAGRPMALFPEGTTDAGAAVLPFRPSLLASLYPPLPDVRVQPVAIDYGAAADDIAWVGTESALANVRRVLSRPRTTPVTLRFLASLDPVAAGDRKVLASAARDAIVAALGASARPPDLL